MDTFQVIGVGLNAAELAVSKAIGQVVGFQHRASLPIPLYVQFIDIAGGAEQAQRGRLVDKNVIRMILPTQAYAFSGASGFSGVSSVTPVNSSGKTGTIVVGDRVEWPIGSGRYFWVVEEGIDPIHYGYSYVVTAREERAVTLGQRS